MSNNLTHLNLPLKIYVIYKLHWKLLNIQNFYYLLFVPKSQLTFSFHSRTRFEEVRSNESVGWVWFSITPLSNSKTLVLSINYPQNLYIMFFRAIEKVHNLHLRSMEFILLNDHQLTDSLCLDNWNSLFYPLIGLEHIHGLD